MKKIKLWWKRLQCFCKDHDLGAYVNWMPSTVCMHIVCARCDKHVAHIDLPANPPKELKERLH